MSAEVDSLNDIYIYIYHFKNPLQNAPDQIKGGLLLDSNEDFT